MQKNKFSKLVTDVLREQLQFQHQFKSQVITNSMSPVIRAGDSIIVEAEKASELIPGDIILIDCEIKYFTHRFVTRFQKGMSNYIVTKGDRVGRFDNPFPDSRVLGKVVEIRTKNRNIDLTRFRYRIIHFLYGKLLCIQWRILNNFVFTSQNRLFRGVFRRLFHYTNLCFSNLLAFRGSL